MDERTDEPVLNDRQALIVERVEQQGFVTIEALARDFAVSAQTVRREIIRLDELGVIQRFHGGAGRRGSGERLPHGAKQLRETDLKRRIGAAAAELAVPGAALFLDVGTTGEALARALVGRGGFIVVTPSAATAAILTADPSIEVVLTGGRVMGPDLSLAGPVALKTVGSYRFDWAFISCSAVDPNGAVLDFDADKIAVKQRAMEMAANKALIVDSTKFARSALMLLDTVEAYDVLVTDREPASLRSKLGGCRVLVASGE